MKDPLAITGPTNRHDRVVFANQRASDLLAAHLDALADPVAGGLTRVKINDSRAVYCGSVNGLQIYVKHYHGRRWVRRLGRLVGASDARHEMAFSQYLAANGVATPEVLATQWRSDLQWLATIAVSPAEPADSWHAAQLADGAPGRHAIRKVTVALAELIGRMHAAGVVHGDMHCGNVLVRTDTPTPQLVLTDLHRAGRRRRLSRQARAANLAHLFHDRFNFTTRTERLRFLKHYLRSSQAEGTLRGWQLMVEHLAARHTRRQHLQRDRRTMGTNHYFAKCRLEGGWRGHVVLASKRRLAGSQAAEHTFTIDQWREVLADPGALLATDGATIHKQSRSGTVMQRRIRIGQTELDVFVKQHRRKSRWKILLDCFRPSRAVRAFRKGHDLLTRRIATALPLVAIERRVGPFLVDGILITEVVPWPRLDHFLQTWLAPDPTGNTRLSAQQQHQLAQDVLWQMGRLLQQLHDNDFAHRDLKATNMFVRWQLGGAPEIVLVDLDGLRRVWQITTRQRFQGLMRLNVSLLQCPAVNNAGQLRMLLGYLRRPGSGHIEFKPYWRVLEMWSARKINQQIRSRRIAQLVRRQEAARSPTA